MNSVTLIWAALRRHKARRLFTWLCVVVAFTLFSILAATRYGIMGQLTIRTAERLDTHAMVSQGTPLPLSYYNNIVSVPGVMAVAYLLGFQGYFRERQSTFQAVFTNAQQLFNVYPEFSTPPAEMRAWLADRQGAVVGSLLARRMGWKVGDTIPVQGGPAQKDGGTTWYFHLRGVYHTDLPSAYRSLFFAHYRYYNQGVAPQFQNLVNQYKERVDDPRNSTRISNAIDALFANSSPQTLTQSEVEEAVSFIRQFGNITAMVIYVGIAVFFSLLLIVGNMLAQSVRERIAEFAMFRALGFRRVWIVLLVIREALLLIVSGGIIGLILGWVATRLLYPSVGNLLQTFQMTWSAAGAGVVLAVVLTILACLAPMQRIASLRVAEALRKS